MDQTDPPTLLDLPRELLHNVITDCNPPDIAAFRAACRSLKNTIDGDSLLYRDVSLRHYDVPPRDGSWNESTSWEDNLKGFTKLQKLLDSPAAERKIDALRDCGHLLDRLVRNSHPPDSHHHNPSKNTSLLNRAFKDARNREAFLARSSLYAWQQKHGATHYKDEETSQASAKMHVYYGAPIRPNNEGFQKVRMDMFARSRVYDLRRYTDDTFWGPFFDDSSARVDWEKLQAIMLVVQYNLSQFHLRTSKRFPLLWHTPWAGIAPHSFVSPTDWRQKKAERIAQAKEAGDYVEDNETLRRDAYEEEMRSNDPYNITGTWMRVVCFLDYSDLYQFNFSDPAPPDDQPRPELDQEEAIRLITMKLRVTKLEKVPDAVHAPGSSKAKEVAHVDHDSEYVDEDEHVEGKASSEKGKQKKKQHELPLDGSKKQYDLLLPGSVIAHFEGTSRSMHVGWDPNANSGIRGTVSTTRFGEVRWTSFSVFHGEERWRSEGIQVGGPQSARGVWGSWFDKDFDREGPAGPTAFWKLTDELPPSELARAAAAATESTTANPNVNYSQPIFVNNGQPNDMRNGQLGQGNQAVGVFGAAASPDRDVDGQDDAEGEGVLGRGAQSHLTPDTNLANVPGAGPRDLVGLEQQHPYNQTILTGADDEENEVLLEIEDSDDDGDVGGTVTLPASSILEILEAQSGESSEEDEDYAPPARQVEVAEEFEVAEEEI